MNEPAVHTLSGGAAPIVIGARGVEAILQNVRTILNTLGHSVVLDRRFAWAGELLDQPSPYAVQRECNRIIQAIETYEPRVKVRRVRLERTQAADAMDGVLRPVVELEIRHGADL